MKKRIGLSLIVLLAGIIPVIAQTAEVLKQQIVRALIAADTVTAQTYLVQYLRVIRPPYTKEQRDLILPFATSVQTPAFRFLYKHYQQLEAVAGDHAATGQLQNIIYHDLVEKKLLLNKLQPDWKAIRHSTRQFGLPGKRIYFKSKAFFHFNHQQWDAFAEAFAVYYPLDTANCWTVNVNNYTWTFFEHATNPHTLQLASGWMDLVMDRTPDTDFVKPGFLDTKANLLYKLGEKAKAIAVQKRAVDIAKATGGNVAEFEATLQKMEAGRNGQSK